MATPEEGLASMIANLKEKTGRTLEEWLKIAKAAKLSKHGEIVKHLKSEHQLTHGYANMVAHKCLGSDAGSAESGDDLVEAQYAGAKASLKLIYTALMSLVNSLGKDVTASPKKAYVSVRRTKQFAIIQPSTATRVDLGINLKGVKPVGRLEASGSFNAMVSHRIRLEKAADIDTEVKAWLKQAYEAS